RDLALIKVSADREQRPPLMQLAEVFGARVVDVAPQSIVIEMAGSEAKIDGLLEVLRPYGVLEMVRTGRVAMSRGIGTMPRAGRWDRRRRESGMVFSVNDDLAIRDLRFAARCDLSG